MWDTSSLWFDVAIVMTVFAVGSIRFGHFEEHKPKRTRARRNSEMPMSNNDHGG